MPHPSYSRHSRATRSPKLARQLATIRAASPPKQTSKATASEVALTPTRGRGRPRKAVDPEVPPMPQTPKRRAVTLTDIPMPQTPKRRAVTLTDIGTEEMTPPKVPKRSHEQKPCVETAGCLTPLKTKTGRQCSHWTKSEDGHWTKCEDEVATTNTLDEDDVPELGGAP